MAESSTSKKADAPAKKTVAKKAAEPVKKTAAEPTEQVSEPEATKARKAPPVKVPSASSRSTGGPSRRVKELQVMLGDLGLYPYRIDGFYTSQVRNAVSALQEQLKVSGDYFGIPHGAFDEATRAALLASDIPTQE